MAVGGNPDPSLTWLKVGPRQEQENGSGQEHGWAPQSLLSPSESWENPGKDRLFGKTLDLEFEFGQGIGKDPNALSIKQTPGTVLGILKNLKIPRRKKESGI